MDWTFRPAASKNRLGGWVRENVGGLEVAVPADFGQATLDNGWQRFSAQNIDAFVAIRMEAGRVGELGQRQRHWLDVAGASADDFVSTEPYEIERADQRWLRSDYAYTDLMGNVVAGSFAGKSIEDQLIFIWSEAPATTFEALDHDVFDVVAADVRPED